MQYMLATYLGLRFYCDTKEELFELMYNNDFANRRDCVFFCDIPIQNENFYKNYYVYRYKRNMISEKLNDIEKDFE